MVFLALDLSRKRNSNSLEVLICLGFLVLQALVSVVLLLIERGQADVVVEVRDEQHSADTRLGVVPSTHYT